MRKWGNMIEIPVRSICAFLRGTVPFTVASALRHPHRSSRVVDCFHCRGGCNIGGTVLPAYHFLTADHCFTFCPGCGSLPS